MAYKSAEDAAAGAARKARYEAEVRERAAAIAAADKERRAAYEALPIQRCADCGKQDNPRGPHSHCMACGAVTPQGESFCDDRCEEAYYGDDD